MKLRTAVFLVAISATACSGASNQPQKLERDQRAPVAAETTKSMESTQSGSLRDSFQKCVDEAAGATWPTQDCIADEYDYQDARLNHAYRRLMKTVSKQESESLRARQRAWIIERDDACPWDADTEGQARRLEANYCAMERTAIRATELERELQHLGQPAP